jgi:hypothetical protein
MRPARQFEFQRDKSKLYEDYYNTCKSLMSTAANCTQNGFSSSRKCLKIAADLHIDRFDHVI